MKNILNNNIVMKIHQWITNSIIAIVLIVIEDLKEHLVKLEIKKQEIDKSQIVYLKVFHHKKVQEIIMKLFQLIKFREKGK